MDSITAYTGEIAALSAAFVWALSAVIWGRIGGNLRATELNFFKGLLGIGMLLLTMLVRGESLSAIDHTALLLLVIGGAIGIGMGDTAFFESLKAIGPRRTLLLGTLAPPLTGLLAWAALGERLSTGAWLGILVTVAGVAWVVSERSEQSERSELGAPGDDPAVGTLRQSGVRFNSAFRRGLTFAMLANLAQACGAVLSRFAFLHTSVSPLQSALIRLAAGVGLLLVWLILMRQPLGAGFKVSQPARLWSAILIATFLGTYLGVWLQQLSLNLAMAGIGQTLISTSPLFVLIPAALLGEKISLRAVLGVVMALGGIAMLFGLR